MPSPDDSTEHTPHFARLSPDQSKKVAEASFEILERTGVRLDEPRAVELLRKAGAQVSDGDRVRIPVRLVEWALAAAPRRIVLYDRSGRPAIPLEGRRTYFGTGSDCLHLLDHRTGQRRAAVLRDVVEAITLCDALEHIDFVMSVFLPGDVRPEIADRYQAEIMLQHTSKPLVLVSYETSGMIDAIEMAEAVAGGPAALSARPFVAAYINVTTPLRHNAEALQKLLYLAEKNIPACYIPGATAGMVAPVTVAGSVALRYAGALAGLVMAQLTREGAPIIMPGWGALHLDMRTMVQAYTGPDHQGVALALAHHFGLPAFAAGGMSEAKVVDQQAAMEAALTLLMNAVVGGHLVHDVGYLESGLAGSLAQLVICNEALAWVKRATQPLEVSAESLAVETVDQVGPDGQFLDSEHTLQHFQEHWYPELFERDNYEGWLAAGAKTLAERAGERVDEILAAHRPSALPDQVTRTLRAIVARAEAQAAG